MNSIDEPIIGLNRNREILFIIFTQMRTGLDKQIGSPDLLILFTSTVSHKMIRTAVDGTKGGKTEIVRCHSSSKTALEEILQERCNAC